MNKVNITLPYRYLSQVWWGTHLPETKKIKITGMLKNDKDKQFYGITWQLLSG